PDDPQQGTPIDLQAELFDLPDRTWEQIRARSRILDFGRASVRILGPEDSLRLSCLHFLRHSGSNPVWLCDVGVMLEHLPADFDWDYALDGNPLRTHWMIAVLRVAGRLLGARLEEIPNRRLPAYVPDWMVRTLLRAWGN